MSTPRNIIFDLGAVLFDIDFEKAYNAFFELGIPDFNQQYSQLKANDLFTKLETGKIDENEFYDGLKNQVKLPLSNQQLKKAWNAILVNFRKESMAFVKDLRKEHRVFLLSNTNIIHLNEINNHFVKEVNEKNLNAFFEKAYYSFEVGMRKPDENIFHYLLKDAAINPEDTLFIDDAFPNIETAKRIGIKTHLLLPEERIENIIF
jgi:putative hydrolase of the HAD superfamily